MGASNAYAVEDIEMVLLHKKNGIAASLMDYARYNYSPTIKIFVLYVKWDL
jgi:hypothetical protein